MPSFINIGYGNMVAAHRIVAIIGAHSSPIKRMISDAKGEGRLIDATFGRRTRAVIICDSNHVLLSPVLPETVAQRVSMRHNGSTEGG